MNQNFLKLIGAMNCLLDGINFYVRVYQTRIYQNYTECIFRFPDVYNDDLNYPDRMNKT